MPSIEEIRRLTALIQGAPGRYGWTSSDRNGNYFGGDKIIGVDVERLPDGRFLVIQNPGVKKAAAAAATVAADLQDLRDAVEFTARFDFDISVVTTYDVVTLVMPAGKTKFFVNRLLVECKTQGTGAGSTATIVLKRQAGGNIFNAQTVVAAAQLAGQYTRISNVGVGVAVCVNGDVIQLQVTAGSSRNSIMTLYVLGTFV